MFLNMYVLAISQIVNDLNMTAFWDVAPCSLMEGDRRFRGVYCLRYQGFITVMMKAVRASETSVYFHETTRCYMPESCRIHTR
jgi:hypothetical protein